jgi:hypothetical protein
LIREHRRKHGSDQDQAKGRRPDYVKRTVQLARREREADAYERTRDEALAELAELAHEPVVGPADARLRIELFNEIVSSGQPGAPRFAELQQHGRAVSVVQYVLVCDSGQSIHLGGPSALTNQREFRDAVMAATSHVMSLVKPARWDAALRGLMSAVTIYESPEETPGGIMLGWVKAYLDRDLEVEDRNEAMRDQRPFLHEEQVYVHPDALAHWVRQRRDQHLRNNKIAPMLKAAGFAPRRMTYKRRDGNRSTVTYWHVDQDAIG